MASTTFLATTNNSLSTETSHEPDGIESPEKMLLSTGEVFGQFFQTPNAQSGGCGRVNGESTKERKPKAIVVHGSNGSYPTRKGLVGSILYAYNNHYDLQLRPDDVWIAILTQFCAYVNGRAEKLRHKFVSHEGQKELKVCDVGTVFSANFASLTRCMLDEIGKNVKDESLKEWLLPGFTTTTKNDEVCAAATAMCTFQKYFSYKFQLACGIPRVVLMGTVDDWRKLRTKVDRLMEFEDEEEPVLGLWVPLLEKVCDNFVESATNGSKNNLHFWDTVCCHHGGGSGPSYLSGWVTVFNYFDEDGKPIRNCLEEVREGKRFFGEMERAFFGGSIRNASEMIDTSDIHSSVVTDASAIWPVINTNDIHSNVVSCPVTIDDNGVEYKARLFVGQMTYDTKPAAKPHPSCILPTDSYPVIQTRNDWALAIAERL